MTPALTLGGEGRSSLHILNRLNGYTATEKKKNKQTNKRCIHYSHIVLIIAIWPGDRIRRPEHSTVEHGSCDESV